MVLGPCGSPDLLRFTQRVRQASWNDDDAMGSEGLPRPITDAKASGSAQDVVDRDGLEWTELQVRPALDAANREVWEAYVQGHQEAVKEVRSHVSCPSEAVGS